MACNTNSLSAKEVVSLCDGRKLGHITNYEIDLSSGTVTAVFVPGECGFFPFGKSTELRIPWDRIKKIGEDAVLVDIPAAPPGCTPGKKRWFR